MANPAITVADGQGAAGAVADGATQRITPGNVITVALSSSTGVQRWALLEDGTQLNAGPGGGPNSNSVGRGFRYEVGSDGPFTTTFTAPMTDCQIALVSEVLDGSTHNAASDRIVLDCRHMGKTNTIINCRFAIIGALAAYTYTAGTIEENANGAWVDADSDGVTPAVGDYCLLAVGTAADQGAYQIQSLGSASSKFKLVRVPEMAHGMVIGAGAQYNVSEGTKYANTVWKNTLTGNCTVGTSSPAPYPREVQGSVALVAGTTTVSRAILSTTTTHCSVHRIVANTSTATTGGYHPTVGGANGFTAGVDGTGQVVIEATVAAGTINNADISTVQWKITNKV